MGAYHAMNIALRYPERFNRVLGMSGPYDMHQMSEPYPIFDWVNHEYDQHILECDPSSYIREMKDEAHLKKIKQMEII
ncbi:hypothetical protein ABTE74_22155, partial [Acinetobacter baumannii]